MRQEIRMRKQVFRSLLGSRVKVSRLVTMHTSCYLRVVQRLLLLLVSEDASAVVNLVATNMNDQNLVPASFEGFVP